MTTGATTIADAIRWAILYQLNNIHTAMPAQIISYDFTTQKATVQPTINKSWTNGPATLMPILQNVPVIFCAAGGGSLTFPVVAGDTCLLLICERSIDDWLSQGGNNEGVVTPSDPRKFDLSDAVAIMGLKPFSSTFPAARTNNTDAIFNYAGSSFTINETGQINILSSSGSSISILPTGQINIIETGGSQIDILPTGEIDITSSSGSVISITDTGAIKLNTVTTIALGTPAVEVIQNLINVFGPLATVFTDLLADPFLSALNPASKAALAAAALAASTSSTALGTIKGTLP